MGSYKPFGRESINDPGPRPVDDDFPEYHPEWVPPVQAYGLVLAGPKRRDGYVWVARSSSGERFLVARETLAERVPPVTADERDGAFMLWSQAFTVRRE